MRNRARRLRNRHHLHPPRLRRARPSPRSHRWTARNRLAPRRPRVSNRVSSPW